MRNVIGIDVATHVVDKPSTVIWTVSDCDDGCDLYQEICRGDPGLVAVVAQDAQVPHARRRASALRLHSPLSEGPNIFGDI